MSLFSNLVIGLLIHLAVFIADTGRNENVVRARGNDQRRFSFVDTFRNNAEACCQTGRIQAESTKACTNTLQSLITETTNKTNSSVNCRFLTHICCLSNLRHHYCEEGLKTALRLVPCNETKLESKDTYQVRRALAVDRTISFIDE